mmetsp:Transcript_95903/g.149958  ORF Transcript_95903/g.149958 Transcript_95903/m.149958 type:complete len:621 (+) Transcript_95903:96-1958(+)
MHRLRRKKQEAEESQPPTQASGNETKTRRATRLLTGAATVASKMFQTIKSSRRSQVSVTSVEAVSIVPGSSSVDLPNKGEQRNRKSLLQRGRDFVGNFSRRTSRKDRALSTVRASEHEEEENSTKLEDFSLAGSQGAVTVTTAGTRAIASKATKNSAGMKKSDSEWTLASLDDEEIMQRIRQEEAQLLWATSNTLPDSSEIAPKKADICAKKAEVDKKDVGTLFRKPGAKEGKKTAHAATNVKQKVVDDRADEWTCWHVTPIDVIIDFQLYELLQKKWRFKVPELLEDKKESEAEIISEMINKRRLVKEELNGDAKHTIGFKTMLIKRFLERVYANIERCVLVEQDYNTFLEITFGRLVDFNPQEHLEFIRHHKDLAKDYRSLMKPSTDSSDDDLLHELRKPMMSDQEAEQLREVFVQLDKYDTGVVSVYDLKRHNDFCVADFQSFEFVEKIDFDVFLALVCPSTHRTTSTVWEIIIKKMRSRLEQLSDTGRIDMPLADALASLEDPLLPTLPPQIIQIYQEVYNQLDWSSSSCLVAWIKHGIKHLLEEPRAIGYSLRLEQSGRLSFTEFTGFVRLDAYKRFSTAPTSCHRQAITANAVEMSQHFNEWSLSGNVSRSGRR